jgi:hypothetical protein
MQEQMLYKILEREKVILMKSDKYISRSILYLYVIRIKWYMISFLGLSTTSSLILLMDITTRIYVRLRQINRKFQIIHYKDRFIVYINTKN